MQASRLALGRLFVVLALGVGTPDPAWSGDPPSTVANAVDTALSAWKAKDDAALGAVAAKDEPDPWLVADALLARGEDDAATAFAKAAPRRAIETLPAYVASRRGKPDDAAGRRALARAEALLSTGSAPDALDVLERAAGDSGSLTATRILATRGRALHKVGRLQESVWRSDEAAQAARSLGWWTMAANALTEGATSAQHNSDFPAGLDRWEEVLEIARSLGDRRLAATAVNGIGILQEAQGDLRGALASYERALEERQAIGDLAGVAGTSINLGSLHGTLGDNVKALEYLERGLAQAQQIGNRQWAANALNNIGLVHDARGDLDLALTYYERALAEKEAIGDARGISSSLSNIGGVHMKRGEYAKGLELFERVLEREEKLGNRVGIAIGLLNVGTVHFARGDYPKARALQERAFQAFLAIGDRVNAMNATGNLGITYQMLGDYPRALSLLEQGLKEAEALGDRSAVAGAQRRLGTQYERLGDYDRALAYFERALEEMRALGERTNAVLVASDVAAVHHTLGDPEKALTGYQAALAEAEAGGNPDHLLGALIRVGWAWIDLRQPARARPLVERALKLAEEQQNRTGVAAALLNLGVARWDLGERREGLDAIERAVREARRLRLPRATVDYLGVLARTRLEADEPEPALAAAQSALVEMEALLGGLGEEEGAAARADTHDVLAYGTLAAARLGRIADALTFLESGRAGSLLETLGGRATLQYSDLPPDVREDEARANAGERRARLAYEQALSGDDRAQTKQAARALDESMQRVRDVVARIQREAKRQAGLYYPRAATLEEIQGRLATGQTLAVYGLCPGDALALVITAKERRIVSLGATRDVVAACAALRAEDVSSDVEGALSALKARLIAPLGLGEGAELVLVSPEGPLCYVPWAALFDRSVAVTPSGTTHVLLLDEERRKGEGVLALGDPESGGLAEGGRQLYARGRMLAALPATRAEATSVGDVVLLGKDANEEALAQSLHQHGRWRATHFACHALVDAERPTLSSLVLSPSKGADGFLTANEVLRMRIPADLAVLSACETATGRIVTGEGIVGLTRTFMYAGTPRVLCSLWKVDDEATSALMAKFYAVWNPKDGATGAGTAAALRAAQEHVRSIEKWRHPRFWAAWVLWGLPD